MNELTPERRNAMVDALIKGTMDVNDHRELLETLLRSGVRGYEQYTDEELIEEYESSGLGAEERDFPTV